jgi:hypothetical protein
MPNVLLSSDTNFGVADWVFRVVENDVIVAAVLKTSAVAKSISDTSAVPRTALLREGSFLSSTRTILQRSTNIFMLSHVRRCMDISARNENMHAIKRAYPIVTETGGLWTKKILRT